MLRTAICANILCLRDKLTFAIWKSASSPGRDTLVPVLECSNAGKLQITTQSTFLMAIHLLLFGAFEMMASYGDNHTDQHDTLTCLFFPEKMWSVHFVALVNVFPFINNPIRARSRVGSLFEQLAVLTVIIQLSLWLDRDKPDWILLYNRDMWEVLKVSWQRWQSYRFSSSPAQKCGISWSSKSKTASVWEFNIALT